MDVYDRRHHQIIEWLRLEWPYQRSKFSEQSEQDRTSTVAPGQPLDDDAWKQAIDNYYLQGMLIGVDEVRGRQRVAKALATLVAELVFVTEQYGDLPEPGHSSSEDTRKWLGMPK